MTAAKSEFKLPMVIGVVLVGGFLSGVMAQTARTKWVTEEPLTASEMRNTLVARCVAAPDVIAEIEQKLPDNEDGLITPTIVRQVLKDVVSKC